jgi:hypothetical protein
MHSLGRRRWLRQRLSCPARAVPAGGRDAGEVTLGSRRLAIERPRVRSADGRSELPLETYAHFADRDPLTKVVLERMLAGVSTRRYRRARSSSPPNAPVAAAAVTILTVRNRHGPTRVAPALLTRKPLPD